MMFALLCFATLKFDLFYTKNQWSFIQGKQLGVNSGVLFYLKGGNAFLFIARLILSIDSFIHSFVFASRQS